MDKATKGKIINAVRRLSFAYKPRNEAKNKQKVAPATFRCEGCKDVIYTGKKTIEKAGLEELIEAGEEVRSGKICLDHALEIVPVEGFPGKTWDWNIYLERLFCDAEGFQVLCEDCNYLKTQEENQQRKLTREKNNSFDKSK